MATYFRSLNKIIKYEGAHYLQQHANTTDGRHGIVLVRISDKAAADLALRMKVWIEPQEFINHPIIG